MVPSDQQIYDLLITRLKSVGKHSSKEVSDSQRVDLCFKGFTVNCPRLPLVRESKFFEAVFMNKSFADSGEDTFVLKNEEFTMFSFAKVLEFIFDKYDSRSKNMWDYRRRKLEMDLKLDNFQSVVELGSYLQVKDIDTACTQFIVDKLEVENVMDVFEMAFRLNMDKLMEASQLYVGYHLVDILPELSLVSTSVDFIKMALSLDQAKIPNESFMLDFLWDWVKCDLETRKTILDQLIPLVRMQYIPDPAVRLFYKKIEKKLGKNSSTLELIKPTQNHSAAPRSWPQLLVVCDSLARSESDLQELSFAEIKLMLGGMFSTRDLAAERPSWGTLEPPRLKLETVKEIVFAGDRDSIFIIVKKQFGFTEDSDEFVLSIWQNDLRGKKPAWSKLAQRQPREIHQLSNIRAKFCWNILLLTGSISGRCCGYYLDLCSYEPEWLQWRPLAQHSVADLCAGQGILWVVTHRRRLCSCALCEDRDTLDTEKVFPSGVAVTVRQIAGPEDMAQPRLAAYQDSVMAVGGQDPNTKKCLVYDMAAKEWGEVSQLTEGRSEPGLVTVGTQVYAVGGRGFYWHETVGSVERLDWEDGEGWQREEGSVLNLKGSPTVLTVNKPVSFMLGREKQCTNGSNQYAFSI